ncbi:alpha/beta hydrolase [Streptomyces sp. AK02-01A]|uniref:alpha/beta hydrolase n=1 Tax=Streptomyces sp. AK02-01A TaxID=3028648 RepID=UPI0029BA1D72|nr:alpha/beta hydrolase [Streptomyces sp. AK02-01A]MDX3850858.1 alpha/beta hydrolase [Streptomyces sp. AK02-01A]
MTTWQQLRDVRLSEYEDAADGWGKISGRANAAKDRVDNEMLGTLRETQKGETATGATADLSRLSRNYQYIHTECGLIRTALNGLAAELAAPQKKLKQALEDAENRRFTVRPDGSVEYPVSAVVPLAPGRGTATPGAPVPLLPGRAEGGADPNKADAEDIAERIAGAVGEAAEIDGRYAGVLRALKTTGGLDVTDAMLADAAQDTRALREAAGKYADASAIPQGKSAADNASWWNGLTQEQRDEYATLYPAEVGALDGIPSDVRDDANRMVLAETRAQAQLSLDGLGPEPPKMLKDPNGGPYAVSMLNPAWSTWDKTRTRLQAQIKGMDAIQKRFDAPPSSGLPPAFLLGFDTKGNGHAIIANGNPDTADHTAVYVPGTTSKLGGIGGDIDRMTELWKEANSQAPGKSVSTITWLGYNAPQSIVPEAMQKQWAYDGSPKLNSFMDGLEATQGGPAGSHTTVIGHSYGSTVVGDASNKGDLSADDIVVAGSPGMMAAEAGDLDVGKDHVWSEAAGDDLVPLGGKAAGLGGFKWGVQTWNGIPYNPGYIQTVPSDEAFGAHRMDVDTSGHSNYWKRDSLSLKNQAAVVVGHYADVKEDD